MYGHYSYHFTHKGAMWWATEEARRTGWRYQVRVNKSQKRRFKRSKFVVSPVKEDKKH